MKVQIVDWGFRGDDTVIVGRVRCGWWQGHVDRYGEHFAVDDRHSDVAVF